MFVNCFVCGVDAFRFDLAGDCALDNNLIFDANGRFMQVIREVADVTGAKISGEPWSACGGYYLGQMAGLNEWNDKHEMVGINNLIIYLV